MKAQKTLTVLFFSLIITSVLVIGMVLPSEDKNEIVFTDDLDSSFDQDTVRSINFIQKYNVESLVLNQSKKSREFAKSLSDRNNISVSIQSLEVYNNTFRIEDESKSGNSNILYEGVYCGSFITSKPMNISRITVSLSNNSMTKNNEFKFGIWNSSIENSLLKPDAEIHSSETFSISSHEQFLYRTLVKLNSTQTTNDTFFLSIMGTNYQTDFNWTYTDDLPGENSSLSYKWTGSDWELLPVDFHMNLTFSPAEEIQPTINDHPFIDGEWNYYGDMYADSYRFPINISMDWYNYSIETSISADFIIETTSTASYEVDPDGDTVWTIPITPNFNESLDPMYYSNSCRWVIPSEWTPQYVINESALMYGFSEQSAGQNKIVSISGLNNTQYELVCTSGNCFTDIGLQNGAGNPTSTFGYNEDIHMLIGNTSEIEGDLNCRLLVKNSSDEEVLNTSITTDIMNNKQHYKLSTLDLPKVHGYYNVSVFYEEENRTGYVETQFFLAEKAGFMFSLPDGTLYQQSLDYYSNYLILNISLYDQNTLAPIPNLHVNYELGSESGELVTDGSGMIQFQSDDEIHVLSLGTHELVLTINEQGYKNTTGIYEFEVVESMPALYEEGLCQFSVESIGFTSKRISANTVRLDVTFDFTDVIPGTFDYRDQIIVNMYSLTLRDFNGPETSVISDAFSVKLRDLISENLILTADDDFSRTATFDVSLNGSSDVYIENVFGEYSVEREITMANGQTFEILIRDYFQDNYPFDQIGWREFITAHLNIILILGAAVIGLIAIGIYSGISKYLIRKELEHMREIKEEFQSRGAPVEIIAYATTKIAEYERKHGLPTEEQEAKLKAIKKAKKKSITGPSLSAQMIGLGPLDRRRFYIKGFEKTKWKTALSIILSILFLVALAAIAHLLFRYVDIYRWFADEGLELEPIVRTILLIAIYLLLGIISFKLGFQLTKPPKMSVKRISKKMKEIINAPPMPVDSEQSDTEEEIHNAHVAAETEEELGEKLGNYRKSASKLAKFVDSPFILIVGIVITIIRIILLVIDYSTPNLIGIICLFAGLIVFDLFVKKTVLPKILEGDYSNAGVDAIAFGMAGLPIYGLGLFILIVGVFVILHEIAEREYEIQNSSDTYYDEYVALEFTSRAINTLSSVVFKLTVLIIIIGFPLVTDGKSFLPFGFFVELGSFIFSLILLAYISMEFVPKIDKHAFDDLDMKFISLSLLLAVLSIFTGAGAWVLIVTVLIIVHRELLSQVDKAKYRSQFLEQEAKKFAENIYRNINAFPAELAEKVDRYSSYVDPNNGTEYLFMRIINVLMRIFSVVTIFNVLIANGNLVDYPSYAISFSLFAVYGIISAVKVRQYNLYSAIVMSLWAIPLGGYSTWYSLIPLGWNIIYIIFSVIMYPRLNARHALFNDFKDKNADSYRKRLLYILERSDTERVAMYLLLMVNAYYQIEQYIMAGTPSLSTFEMVIALVTGTSMLCLMISDNYIFSVSVSDRIDHPGFNKFDAYKNHSWCKYAIFVISFALGIFGVIAIILELSVGLPLIFDFGFGLVIVLKMMLIASGNKGGAPTRKDDPLLHEDKAQDEDDDEVDDEDDDNDDTDIIEDTDVEDQKHEEDQEDEPSEP